MMRFISTFLLVELCLGQQYSPLASPWAAPYSSPLMNSLLRPQLPNSIYSPSTSYVYRNIPTEYLSNLYSSQPYSSQPYSPRPYSSQPSYIPYSPYSSYTPGVVQPAFGNPFIQNPVSYGNVQRGAFPALSRAHTAPTVPTVDTRALCSFCSCESDFGCGYNCNKCEALCVTCDCNTSLGCQYNCDKCEQSANVTGTVDYQDSQDEEASDVSGTSSESSSGSSSEGSTTGSSSGSSTGGSSTGSTGSSGTSGSSGSSSFTASARDGCDALLNSQIELCMWGPSCKSVLTSLFPNCNYNCNTCQLFPSDTCIAESGPAAGQPCVFPFIYQGNRYDGCAPLHSEDELKFWCSTRTDVNGFHVRGQYPEVGKFVGYCSDSCPKAVPTFY